MTYVDEHATPPGWQLDELASAGRENLDVDHVASYDARRTPTRPPKYGCASGSA